MSSLLLYPIAPFLASIIILLCTICCDAFLSTLLPPKTTHAWLHLIPLSQIHDLHFLSSMNFDHNGRLMQIDDRDILSNYALYIAEEDDLPAIAQLIVNTFGADVITLSGDLSSFEQALFNPGVGAWNSYANAVAYMDVLNGLRQRTMQFRGNIPCPSYLDSTNAGPSSIILAVAKLIIPEENPFEMDVIATVELRLQPPDAKIPFSQPWIDDLERLLVQRLGILSSSKDVSLQPYLSNLCVSSKARRRNIGKALVQCVESIVHHVWGYSKVYLHVDPENEPAMKLYTSAGYCDVGVRWNPFWAGSAVKISYLVKMLPEKAS